MSERFYVSSPLAPGAVMIEGAEAHHLAVVCRLRAGNPVCLFNGDGREYPAVVQQAGKHSVTLDVLRIDAPQRELDFRVELAVPLPRGDRAQFLVEKLTELGAARLVPLVTRRSVVHGAKQDKLKRWVIEASKQCGRNALMEIAPEETWATYCRRSDLTGRRLVAHVGADGVHGQTGVRENVALAVGPEGGFTEEEIEAARAEGWRVVHLGPRILRVETAAIALLAHEALKGGLEADF